MSDLNAATPFIVAVILWDEDVRIVGMLNVPCVGVGVVLNAVGAKQQRVVRLSPYDWDRVRDDWRPGATVWVTPALLDAFADREETDATVR